MIRLLVTAGGTREPIDSVRFIGNRSSGKMGFALAERAATRGARVTLIAGPVPDAAVEPPPVLTEQIARLVKGVINLDRSQRIVLVLDPDHPE